MVAQHGPASDTGPYGYDGHGVTDVAIELLRPADTPRLGSENEDHVRRLVAAGPELPPILVNRRTMRVMDGTHRLRAAMLRNQRSIRVVFFDGDVEDAFIRAVQENTSHGLPLSLAERRSAAGRILRVRPELSDRMIGKWTGLSPGTVRILRQCSTEEIPQSNTRIGSDNRLRPVNGNEGRRRAVAAIRARPEASLREIARTAAVSVGTAHDVRKRMAQGEDPLRTARQMTAVVAGEAAVSSTVRIGQVAPGPLKGSGETDQAAQLRRLQRDPALRHTDLGRELLRWLHRRVVSAGEWPGLVDSVPSHCVGMVTELARGCAQIWNEFADELEHCGDAVLPLEE